MTPEHRKILADAWDKLTPVVVTMKSCIQFHGRILSIGVISFDMETRECGNINRLMDDIFSITYAPFPTLPPKSHERELAEEFLRITDGWAMMERLDQPGTPLCIHFGTIEPSRHLPIKIRKETFVAMQDALTALLEQHRREVLEEASKVRILEDSPTPAPAKSQGERIVEENVVVLKRSGPGDAWSMRFKGQSELLWHSGDLQLMERRRCEMIHTIGGWIDAALSAEREKCAKAVSCLTSFGKMDGPMMYDAGITDAVQKIRALK